MEYKIDEAILLLSNSPSTIRSLIKDLSADWYEARESNDSWSPKEILAHLIHGELTDWIPRTKIILDPLADKELIAFDMSAHQEYLNRNLIQLLDEFSRLRSENISTLQSLDISNDQLRASAIHPAFGEISLKEHLAAWVVHDLGHIAQICRVMAKQYKDQVGPWSAYMAILNDRLKPSTIADE